MDSVFETEVKLYDEQNYSMMDASCPDDYGCGECEGHCDECSRN